MTTRRPRPKFGEPSAESGAEMASHRARVMAEEELSGSQRHKVGEIVDVRTIDGEDWQPATVLAARNTTQYGWTYGVRFTDGREQKVTAQRLRKHRRPR